MVVLQYPAVLQKDDNDTWLLTFPDFDDAGKRVIIGVEKDAV
jgi:hypothetical protein